MGQYCRSLIKTLEPKSAEGCFPAIEIKIIIYVAPAKIYIRAIILFILQLTLVNKRHRAIDFNITLTRDTDFFPKISFPLKG